MAGPFPSWSDVKALLSKKVDKPAQSPLNGDILTYDTALGNKWRTPDAVVAPPEATGTVKGLVRLTNDLTGTADSPQLKQIFSTSKTIGSSTGIPRITFDTAGRAIGLEEVGVSGGGGGTFGVVDNGDGTYSASPAGGDPGTGVGDASTASKGVLQLTGDLSGTADSPTLKQLFSQAKKYGSATQVPVITVDTAGRVSSVDVAQLTYEERIVDLINRVSALEKSGGAGTGTGADTGTGTGTTTPTTNGPDTTSYTESSAVFPNPERGFFHYTETHYRADSSARGVVPITADVTAAARNANRTVIFRYYVMEAFVDGSVIPQSYLDSLTADLQACRDGGVKMLPRFCYSNSGAMGYPIYDAPTDVTKILAHQGQLAPVLNNYRDVVHAVQCGLIGMWGEWYYTDTYGDKGVVTDAQWAQRMQVLDRWVSALDPSIYVEVRYVGIKARRYGQTTTTGDSRRVGFHNDAFLAPYGDYGTFSTFTTMDEATARQYMADQSLIAPVSGESASYNGDDSNGTAAKAALSRYHWDLLNPSYNQQVLGSWTTDETAEITRRLGYRLILTSASWPALAPNTSGTFSFTLKNTGYAPMRHGKTLYVTVQLSPTVFTRYAVAGDAVIPPGYSATYTGTIVAPSTEGSYGLHVELVDPLLPTRGEFAVRLANVETTYTATRNRVGSLTVSAAQASGVPAGTVNYIATESGDTLVTGTSDSIIA